MDFIKTLFWIFFLYLGAYFLKRYYYAFRYRQIANSARYKWHLLEPKEKSLVLCSEWSRKLNNILRDPDSENSELEKLYNNANHFLRSEYDMEICFESGIIELWDALKLSGDFDIVYAKATLDRLFIKYEESGAEFYKRLENYNDQLKHLKHK